MNTRLCLAVLLFALTVAAHSQPGAPNLLRSGDFETEPPTAPLPGWTMWGDQKWKDPKNYTRDLQNPHSGHASLRIFRPAGTDGYIVTDVHQNQLRTRPGQVYEISFWARTDRPGPARFDVQAYKDIETYSGYTAPATYNFEPGANWQRFSYTLIEGVDFFAAGAPYLMLAFHAAPYGAAIPDKTLWIDDVAVIEKPAPANLLGMLDPATVPHQPLHQDLLPGPDLRINIDVADEVRPTARPVGAVSFHRLAGYMGLPYNRQGQYALTPGQEAAIRELRLPHTRFYGVGDEPFPLPEALDKAASVLDRTGIPRAGTVLELEDQGATRALPPEKWAAAAAYSVQKGLGCRDWEIANEPWAHGNGPAAFPTAEDYVNHVHQVSAALRRAQPNARIGVAFGTDGSKWGNYVLRATAGDYDFVVAHWYSFVDVNTTPFEGIAAGENYRILDQMLRTDALIRAYNPGRDVYQYDTEWSLHTLVNGGANKAVQNGNIVGVLHRAVRLIYYLREDIVRGASAWEMFSGNEGWNSLGLLAPQGNGRSMLYWLHRTFNEHTGPTLLKISGTAPYYQPDPKTPAAQTLLPGPLTPAVATQSADGNTLYLTIANASWTQYFPCTIQLKHFRPQSATATVLSSSDSKASPLLVKKEDFVSDFPVKTTGPSVQYTLPPHCVVFLTLKK